LSQSAKKLLHLSTLIEWLIAYQSKSFAFTGTYVRLIAPERIYAYTYARGARAMPG